MTFPEASQLTKLYRPFNAPVVAVSLLPQNTTVNTLAQCFSRLLPLVFGLPAFCLGSSRLPFLPCSLPPFVSRPALNGRRSFLFPCPGWHGHPLWD